MPYQNEIPFVDKNIESTLMRGGGGGGGHETRNSTTNSRYKQIILVDVLVPSSRDCRSLFILAD